MKKLNHNTIKGFGAGLLVAAAIAGSGLPAQALSTFQQINVSMGGISLFVDGKLQVPTDVNGNEVEPLIYAGTTYLPVRALTGMLTDKPVEWDPKTESVYIGTKPGAGRVVRADGLTPYDSSTPLAWTGESAQFTLLEEVQTPFNKYKMGTITGLRPVTGGQVVIDGQDITHASPREIIQAGVGLIPEDRKKVGTVHSFSIDKNLILRDLNHPDYCHRGVLNDSVLTQRTDQAIEEFDIRYSNRKDPVSHLSGGNLQKVILAREMKAKPKLLIAMHPTRGLDVGAIEFIHHKILDAANAGMAVLLVSTELEEIVSLSDTVSVMSSGALSAPLRGKQLIMENLGLLMGGVNMGGGVSDE